MRLATTMLTCAQLNQGQPIIEISLDQNPRITMFLLFFSDICHRCLVMFSWFSCSNEQQPLKWIA